MYMKKHVGEGLYIKKGGWKFSGDVPLKFDNHIQRSVPLYFEGHNQICDLCDFFVKNESIIYDLGCSTGTLSLKLAEYNKEKNGVQVIGVDVEPEMIKMAQKKMKTYPYLNDSNMHFVVDDVTKIEIEAADLIVCYYTVQFISPSVRQEFINKLYKNLNCGGALLLFEKVRGADARFQDVLTSLYTDFKIRQGYSAEDIIAKAKSLEGILKPFSTQENIVMLKDAGFNEINTIQKYICFEGFMAIK